MSGFVGRITCVHAELAAKEDSRCNRSIETFADSTDFIVRERSLWKIAIY